MKATLIKVFKQWGKPKSIQVDNCLPFVTPPRDIPTPLLMWLIGIGIGVQRIRPYQPTDNAVVERMQDVTYRWAEPYNCKTVEALNKALEQTCQINRSQYPCDRLGGRTRAEAYPDLLKGGTPYQENDYDIQRVLQFLAKGNWIRKASKKGVICFCSQRWNISIKYKGQDVFVHLDVEQNEWVVSSDQAIEIKRFKNDFITQKKILKLELEPIGVDT